MFMRYEPSAEQSAVVFVSSTVLVRVFKNELVAKHFRK
jgi:hypothetical protein